MGLDDLETTVAPSAAGGPATEAPTVRLLCWNMGAGGPGQRANWDHVGAEAEYDAALLQEAPNPWPSADHEIVPSPGSKWGIIGLNRAQTAIARLSDRVSIAPVDIRPLGHDGPLQLGISRPGTVTVAKLTVLDTNEELLLASVYAQWEGPISGGPAIYSDASMHRILSDLSPLLSWPDLPVIVAGDFNTVYGTLDHSYGGNWTARNGGVFSRMSDLGLHLAGPQAPNGVVADPRPQNLPHDTRNVPTFVTRGGMRNQQLDYCFVSHDLVDRVTAVARNSVEDWGPSDHCRLSIVVGPPHERSWTEQSFLAEVSARVGWERAEVVRDCFDWAHRHQVRLEFLPDAEGHCFFQFDGGPEGLQYTFSVRPRGDVVVQFQFMREPFADHAARERLRQEIVAAVPWAEITPARVGGRPAIPLHLLLDPAARTEFLDVFTRQLAVTRAAMELPAGE